MNDAPTGPLDITALLAEPVAPTADAVPTWRDKALRTTLRAWAQSTSHADRGSLLREAVRLNNAPLCLRATAEILGWISDSDLQRFGLCLKETGGVAAVELPPDLGLPVAIPSDLKNELRRVLPVDLEKRQRSESAPGDGFLHRLRGFRTYNNGTQKAAVRAVATMPPGSCLLVSMSTGSGKSLVFELATLWWRETSPTDELAVSVVIVPTIALALSHEQSLSDHPVLGGSRALVGGMGGVRDQILLDFRRGDVPILFLSPELALSRDVRKTLCDAAKPAYARPSEARGRLAGIFVDEAHIIETWGRSFRPDFQRLPALVGEIAGANASLRVGLLSATINDAAEELLLRQYGQGGPVLRVSERRPRGEFDFVTHSSPDDDSRRRAVLACMDVVPRPAILYTTTVEDAQFYAEALTGRGYVRLALFTGGTAAQDRRSILKRWTDGQLDVIVATSAFGMGIDKSNVRTVVHACLPENPARYYQEIGRAGRDGYQALALALTSPNDSTVSLQMATGQTLTPETAVKRWNAMIREERRQGTAREHDDRLVVATMPLAATHGSVRDSERHRSWNRSLLVQMQRYGALEVLASPDDDDFWIVRMAVDWTDLLNECSEDRFSTLFASRRVDEKQAATEAVSLAAILRPPEQLADPPEFFPEDPKTNDDEGENECAGCVLVDLFDAVEAGDTLATTMECGRCPACRQSALTPSRDAPTRSSHPVWPAGSSAAATTTVGILAAEHPPDGIAEALQHVIDAGIDHLVVPNQPMAVRAADLLAARGGLGWVSTWDEIGAHDGVHSVATAVFFPGTELGEGPPHDVLSRLVDHAAFRTHVPLVLLGEPDAKVGDRSLSGLATQVFASEQLRKRIK